MFVEYINRFRGIAILLIVMGHYLPLVKINDTSKINIFFINIVQGGTALFVFISGLLFHHVFYKRFEFKKFINAKIKNVLTPYLFLAILPITYIVIYGQQIEYFTLASDSKLLTSLELIISYLSTGSFLVAYWYIPFIMVIFLLSPLFTRYIHTSLNVQIYWLIALSLLPIFIHRPVVNISVMQSCILLPTFLFIWNHLLAQQRACL